MAASFEPDTVKVEGLEKLLKALKSKPPVARVGVLGTENVRGSAGGQSRSGNAEIGAAHEYGSVVHGLAQRSFLRVPIADRLQGEMEKSGAFDDDKLKEVIKSGSVVPWLKKVAVLAVKISKEAFDSQGYGKWPGWKDPNYTNNANQVLKDTGQLQDSITYDVKE